MLKKTSFGYILRENIGQPKNFTENTRKQCEHKKLSSNLRSHSIKTYRNMFKNMVTSHTFIKKIISPQLNQYAPFPPLESSEIQDGAHPKKSILYVQPV